MKNYHIKIHLVQSIVKDNIVEVMSSTIQILASFVHQLL